MSQVRVREVIEENNCAGKKTFYIVVGEDDETNKYKFVMDKNYRLPFDKLYLAAVAPDDIVEIIAYDRMYGGDVYGEFTSIVSMNGLRIARCKCNSTLASDGFDVYCPNDQCGLTLASRIRRLGGMEFFEDNLIFDYLSEVNDNYFISKFLSDDPHLRQPFSLVCDPRLWGINYKNLEDALLDKRTTVNLATFVVEPLFREFIESNYFHNNGYSLEFKNISRFYDNMHALQTSRNCNNEEQNLFMKKFIWSLGIESLTQKHVEKLLVYEMTMEFPDSAFVPYAVVLTSIKEMVDSLGFYHLEAEAIAREVYRRRYEFYDIFSAYSNVEIMAEVFKNMLPRLE